MRRGRWTTACGLVVVLSASWLALRPGRVGPEPNPTVVENMKPGAVGWKSDHIDQLMGQATAALNAGKSIEDALAATTNPLSSDSGGVPAPPADGTPHASSVVGYFDRQSVNTGENIGLHISSSVGGVDVTLYRLGWYQGAGATVVQTNNNVAAANGAVPAPDALGTVAVTWPTNITYGTGGWHSGIYVATMRPAGQQSPQTYALFVLRDDGSKAPIVVQVPFNTYQAYNSFGGKSLYEYNSTGSIRASKVSFDRPYDYFDGAGLLFFGDYHLSLWLEREGYDVTYVASGDTHARPNLMNSHRTFVTSYHDEYWTWEMRQNLQSWIAGGKNVAFFSANNMYWQVRYESSASGVPNRVLVGYKYTPGDTYTNDPMYHSATPWLTTTLWRYPPINLPEHQVIGSSYDNVFPYGQSRPYVVKNANHWIYQGTGLTEGQSINGLVGYEWDLVPDGFETTPGLTILSNSPMAGAGTEGPGVRQQTTLWQQSSGALIFNAATTYWPRFLLGDAYWAPDARVGQMTRNLLNHMGQDQPPPTTTTTATTTSTTTTTTTTRPPSEIGSVFVPLTAPQRALDTRYGGGSPSPAGSTINLHLAGVLGIPDNASAVVVNATGVDAHGAGWVQLYPTGRAAVGSSSNLNFDQPGNTIANAATVPIGNNGDISLYTSVTAHLIVDVSGYFVPVTGPQKSGRLRSFDPVRVYDSRSSGTPAAGSITTVSLAGLPGSDSGILAAVLNVTLTNTDGWGYVQVAAGDRLSPGATSSVNASHGSQTIANQVTVPVSGSRTIAFYVSMHTDVIIDVTGWYTSSGATAGTDGLFHAITPTRVLDTRSGPRSAPGAVIALSPSAASSMPATAGAVLGNLTLADAAQPGFVQLAPLGAALGSSSSLNIETPQQTIPNAFTSRVANGQVQIYTGAGGYIIVDVSGWFDG